MPDKEIGVTVEGLIVTVELQRPPNNIIDSNLVAALATAIESLDDAQAVRAVVLCSAGKYLTLQAHNNRSGIITQQSAITATDISRCPLRTLRRFVSSKLLTAE